KAKGVGGGRVGDSDHQVGAWQQAAKERVAQTLAPHAGAAPGPGDEVVQRDHERARAAARLVEVDGVVDVCADALDVLGQRDGVFVGGELAVAAPSAADDAISAYRQSRRVEGAVQEECEMGIETGPDQPLEEAAGVGTDPSRGARPLEWPHVQKHGRATSTLPGLVHEYRRS